MAVAGSLTPDNSDGEQMKADPQLLRTLAEISKQLSELSADPARYEMDTDAIDDLNLARESVDKLINRVERLLE